MDMYEDQRADEWIRGPGSRGDRLALQRERNRRGADQARRILARQRQRVATQAGR